MSTLPENISEGDQDHIDAHETLHAKYNEGLVTDADLDAHEGATSDVHGVGTSEVESTDGAQAKADGAVSDHEDATDPHPQYATDDKVDNLDAGDVGADPEGTAASEIDSHEGESDPHSTAGYARKGSNETVTGDWNFTGDPRRDDESIPAIINTDNDPGVRIFVGKTDPQDAGYTLEAGEVWIETEDE